MHRHTGCIKKQEKPIANMKYMIFTIGWYVLNSLIINSYPSLKIPCKNKNCSNFLYKKLPQLSFPVIKSQFRQNSKREKAFYCFNPKTSFLCPQALAEQYQSRSCDLHHIDKSLHLCILPSRFPNDYLSITDTKTSMHTPTVNRRGFSPHSLFTGYAKQAAQPTLCVKLLN